MKTLKNIYYNLDGGDGGASIAVDPATPPVDPPVDPPVIEPVTISVEEHIILKNQLEQLKASQAGETRKNTDLMKKLTEMENNLNILKTSQMTDEEKSRHEVELLKSEIVKRDEEIEKVKFLDKVKEAAINIIKEHNLEQIDYDLIYNEDIEAMNTKALLLKERYEKLIEDTESKLRGASDTGRPGASGVSSVSSTSFKDAAEATAIFKKMESEKGIAVAREWWRQQKFE